MGLEILRSCSGINLVAEKELFEEIVVEAHGRRGTTPVTATTWGIRGRGQLIRRFRESFHTKQDLVDGSYELRIILVGSPDSVSTLHSKSHQKHGIGTRFVIWKRSVKLL